MGEDHRACFWPGGRPWVTIKGGLWLRCIVFRGEGPLDDGNTCDRMGDQSHTIESEEDCCDSRRAHIRGQGENLFQHGSALTAFRVHLHNGPTQDNCLSAMPLYSMSDNKKQ